MNQPKSTRDPNESWVRDRDKPYGTLISYAKTYIHPDDYYDGLDTLKRQVSRPIEKQNIDTKTFVKELREVLEKRATGFPEGMFFRITGHDEDTDLEFLRTLWRELFPETPVPGLDD